MLRYVLNKLLYGLLVILGVVVVVFFLFQVLPGDPAKMLVGERTDLSTTENIKKELGLDQPVMVQLLGYVNDISPLSVYNVSDEESFFYLGATKKLHSITLLTIASRAMVLKLPYLRLSYQTQRPVGEMIAQAFPKTLIIALISMFFAVVLGITLGIVSAVHANSPLDKSLLVGSVLGMSLPSFFVAILLSWIFAYLLGHVTHLNMTGSLFEIDDFGNGRILTLKNMILPVVTLSIRPLAVITELTRSSMLDVMSMDYITTAKAKGLTRRNVIMRHALKNSLNPVISSSTSWLASLLAGTVFIEYVFDWKGMGTLIVASLDKYDMPVLMGCILFISIILVILNIISDLLYAVVDPRVKLNY